MSQRWRRVESAEGAPQARRRDEVAPGKTTLAQRVGSGRATSSAASEVASVQGEGAAGVRDAAAEDDPFALHLLGGADTGEHEAEGDEADGDDEVGDIADDPVVRALASEAGVPVPDAASYGGEVGADVSQARVVAGPAAEAAADAVDARAFTVGDRVFLGAGERPDDRELMAHELRHVAQQQDAAPPDAGAIDAGGLEVTTPADASEREAEPDGARGAPTPGELQIARKPRGATTQATRDIGAVVRSLAERSDDALRARKAELTAQLAGELAPKERRARSRERDAIEWIEYVRRLERGEDGRTRTDARDAVEAAGAAAAGVDPVQVAARTRVERAYRAGGSWGALLVHPPAGEEDATGQQGAAVSIEAAAFAEEFRAQARHTALGMLDTSSAEIDAALEQYGFAGGGDRLKFAAQDYNREPGRLGELVEDWRTLSRTDERKAEARPGGAQQAALAKTVTELRALSAEADRLQAEERGRGDADWAALDAVGAPTSDGVKARLAEAWLEAESAHPILLAFRHQKYGAVTGTLGGLTAEGAGLEQSILRQAIPKLGNILRVKTAVTSGDLDPLRLGPVIEVTKQQMRVPPGSVRDAVTRDLHAVASRQPITDEVLSALSIALALVSFVPGVGAPAKVAAEATSLAIELRAQVNEYQEWKVAGGMNNTALDVARSVSTHAPGLRPLFLRLAVAGASAASLAQLARLAVRLERVQDASGAADDVLREIDDLGAQLGARHLSDEVAGAVRGAKTYPAKVFTDGAGVERLSKLNAEKVKDGLAKIRGRAYVGGARLEADVAKATANGATGTLQVPGPGGGAAVRVELRFEAELPAATHGADAGPARLELDRVQGAWVARITVDQHIDPRHVEHVVGHELDEAAELVRRYPDGKPAEGFGAEMSAGVMRDGARTNQSTAHDVAAAREIVALHQSHKAAGSAQNAAAKQHSLDEAFKAAGLDEVAEIDAKLRLLQQADAPEELLDQVRRVGTRHVAGEHAAAMGAKGSRFSEDMIDHVMWGRGVADGKFADAGIKGGHFTEQLRQMAYPNSNYVFVEVGQKASGATVARRFDQYKWTGNGPVPAPGSGRFPGETPFRDQGWLRTDMPKTTFDDPEAFLREAEEAWGEWVDGVALSPQGRELKPNEFTARTRSGLQITGFFRIESDGSPVPTTVFVEASWF